MFCNIIGPLWTSYSLRCRRDHPWVQLAHRHSEPSLCIRVYCKAGNQEPSVIWKNPGGRSAEMTWKVSPSSPENFFFHPRKSINASWFALWIEGSNIAGVCVCVCVYIRLCAHVSTNWRQNKLLWKTRKEWKHSPLSKYWHNQEPGTTAGFRSGGFLSLIAGALGS